VLRLVQGFGYAEISSIMGISEAAVRMRLVRARREFKRIFTGLNAERPDEQSLASAPGGEP
jgi:DNA-directed RNA polymerase specialized sigma24 family protein